MKVAVLGSGPSGMMAAISAAQNGAEVVLFEKNEKTGKKMYISGKGRCNVTNDCSPRDFLQNVVTNGKFLQGAIHKFSPADVMEFCQTNGLQLKVERGNRVFPQSDKSSDVIKLFTKVAQQSGVAIRLNCEVLSVEKCAEYQQSKSEKSLEGKKVDSDLQPDVEPKDISDVNLHYLKDADGVNSSSASCDGCFVVDTICGSECFDKVIVATGGYSYRSTGCDGFGYKIARAFGHNVLPLRPALCRVLCKGTQSLEGLSLKNVEVSYVSDGKRFAQFGEMLFTDDGVSGPAVLSLSSQINRVCQPDTFVCVDLKPALDEQTLDARLLRDFSQRMNKNFGNALDALLPERLVEVVVAQSGIPFYKKVHQITVAERAKLVATLKCLQFPFVGLEDINTAIVTSGGVDVKQVNPSTMESKLVRGLYFAGEVLDVDAYTGGFNIQIALSTGFVAGCSAAKQ